MEEQRRGSPQYALPLIVLVICCAFPERAETSKLRITRQPNGSELSSPLVVSTRQTLIIYCTAVNTDSPGTVRGLHWRFPNNSRVLEVNMDQYDVVMNRYFENDTWIGYLRMNRVQLSFAGIYTCVANFSGVPKSCSIEIQVSACVDPGALTNGRLRLTNSTTVKYTCDSGYSLRGASTRHCTARNRGLTGSVPQCIPIRCVHPPLAPVHGQRNVTGLTFGSTLIYSCKAGYTLNGSSAIICMANRQWSGKAPDCSPISCGPAPDAPANGQRSGSGRIFKSIVTYTCNRGYTLQGDNTRTCMADTLWSGSAPTCSPVSCGPAPDAPASGQRSGSGTTVGSTVTYTCSRGYTLQGDNRRTCMANGHWSGRAPTCNPVSCGPAPDAPANGRQNVSGTTFGSTVIYTCNLGYTPQGDNGHTCMANGEWSGRTPTCNPVSCGPAPDAPANGQRNGSGTTFRSAVTYSCDQGYTLEGPSRVTCTHLKLWSGRAPTCNPVSCGPVPDAPANGQRSVSGTTVGSTVNYICDRGYTLQGDNTRTCMANGHWSGWAPTCDPVSCGPAPDAPANGRRSVSGTTFRSAVTYTCNRGYTLQGDNRRTCMANGQWSGVTPHCTGVCSPAPDAPANGWRSGSGTTFGSTVTYTCNRGYTLEGANRHSCMANGQWSGVTPRCSPVSCGPAPDAPANGQRNGSTTTFGSTVTYTCNRGYTLQGDNNSTCMANGQWSGVTTRCSHNNPLATISSTFPSVTTILVNWLIPLSDLGDIQGFTLYWTGLSGQDGGSVTTTSHYHTIVGLSPATGYSIVVQVNAVLGDLNSTAVQAYTLPEVNNTIRVVSDFTTSFEVALNLSLDILPANVESIAVWYSTKGHEGSPTTPPQDAHVVHGSNMTSLTIALPDSSDPCQPYHIWVAGFVSNGQRGPYSKRRRVEVCNRTDDGQSSAAATDNGANVVSLGIFLGGLVAGIVLILLVEGIVFGVMKLRRHGKVTKSAKEMKEDENTYETVEPKQSAALSDHVAMETNPAYASVH